MRAGGPMISVERWPRWRCKPFLFMSSGEHSELLVVLACHAAAWLCLVVPVRSWAFWFRGPVELGVVRPHQSEFGICLEYLLFQGFNLDGRKG